MSSRSLLDARRISALFVGSLIVALASASWAGHLLFRNNNVGGISIDAAGIVREPSLEGRKMLLAELRKDLQNVPPELNVPAELRKVSLRGLEQAIEHALTHNLGRLPDEVEYLAGLQRIQFILVYPEHNDIILAGPGEGWRLDENANMVGITTGRPVLRLDDLLVALRSAREARQTGISCSIDPTEGGYRALNQVLDQQRRQSGNVNTVALEAAMKQAFGPQQVTITGVPASTHVARVLVAADYRMKRYAMNLEQAPVAGLPSFVEMLKSTRSSASVNPRWWIACDYAPLERSEDGLAWMLSGPGCKVMTEDEFVSQDGKVTGTGRVNPIAKRWADLMTENYDELAGKDPVFGELRNIMDMCIVAALIEKEDLLNQAGCHLPLLTGEQSELTADLWNAPKFVAPEVSFLRTSQGLIVTASGGVQIDSWYIASQEQPSAKPQEVRASAAPGDTAKSWWWN